MCRYSKPCWKSYLGSGKYLKQAIKKHGRENFSREIIKECSTLEEMVKYETIFLKEYNCAENFNWYNIMSTGYATNGFLGKKHSKKSNEQRSIALKGKKRPPHIAEAVRKAHTGKKLPKERIEEIKLLMNTNHPTAKKVLINNTFFKSIAQAQKELNLSYYMVNKLNML